MFIENHWPTLRLNCLTSLLTYNSIFQFCPLLFGFGSEQMLKYKKCLNLEILKPGNNKNFWAKEDQINIKTSMFFTSKFNLQSVSLPLTYNII